MLIYVMHNTNCKPLVKF